MRKAQQGFTLIELIMVIVIIGILASVALPKFFDLQSDARAAKLNAVLGAIRSASAIAHSGALIRQSTSATGSIQMEGTAIDLVYGYPDATAAGILAAANIDSNDVNVTAGNPIKIDIKGVEDATKCQIKYTKATSTTGPLIELTTNPPDCK